MSSHNDHDIDDDPLENDIEAAFDDPETFEEELEDLELSPEQRVVELEQEVSNAKEQMLRLAAELENTRRRAQREKTEASQYGLTNFARDLLSVADNFQRAIETLPEQQQEITAEQLAGIINGVKMTEKELLSVFDRNGIKRLYPEGEPFDPNLHQAIAEVPGNGVAKGSVVNVAQPGFTIGDRVLRAAMVTVSNGMDT